MKKAESGSKGTTVSTVNEKRDTAATTGLPRSHEGTKFISMSNEQRTMIKEFSPQRHNDGFGAGRVELAGFYFKGRFFLCWSWWRGINGA